MFPFWTLIGMGVTFLGALLMMLLAYIGQSPRALLRLGLSGSRLDLRVKTLTGYALALMLLSIGFFLAGVPLDDSFTAATTPTPTTIADNQSDAGFQPPSETGSEPATLVLSETEVAVPESNLTPFANITTTASSGSGAFGGPPSGNDEADELDTAVTATNEPLATAVSSNEDTPTPIPATSTQTPTPSSTPTSIPTFTPTPIDGETAVLNLGGSVIWLRRFPGGQNVVVLQDQEIVILQPGRAIRMGTNWREVTAGDGTRGWIEEQFLGYGEEE